MTLQATIHPFVCQFEMVRPSTHLFIPRSSILIFLCSYFVIIFFLHFGFSDFFLLFFLPFFTFSHFLIFFSSYFLIFFYSPKDYRGNHLEIEGISELRSDLHNLNIIEERITQLYLKEKVTLDW